MTRIGIDIGSTTIKAVAIDEGGHLVFKAYERHNARAREILLSMLRRIGELTGADGEVTLCLTGSVGMGVAERCSTKFVQEVVAATTAVRESHPETRSMIDIGGEDAKVVFLSGGKATDLRMNGNCAGGTGAFIDQMAILLGVNVAELDALASQATTVHPIASRCGVFSKTDVQNLVAKNVSRADIAASVFHAVAVQVVVTLAHGCDIEPPVAFCGGPLTFLPSLRKAFADYLKLSGGDIILPTDSHLIPAIGAAMSASDDDRATLSHLIDSMAQSLARPPHAPKGIEPIFASRADHERWAHSKAATAMRSKPLPRGRVEATIGIDSGSTTTKIVAIDSVGDIIFSFYRNNNGDPIETAREGLRRLDDECRRNGTELAVTTSCSTGYGEELLKAALSLDHGIIETIAHYTAARRMRPDVTFILDIGGQDMKAIFVSGGVINRIEINEACSSGCGSFIETFAKSMGYSVADFAAVAAEAPAPYDLGTRCTVFMNSKVKQALREGATVGDIAAGLSYSVVKNCLYKVLRLKGAEELGDHVVVQGGTMKNDSVVRAFERLTGRTVARAERPELMGAIGCAIHAALQGGRAKTVGEMLRLSECSTRQSQCHGCTNRCTVTTYKFGGGQRYFSGNRCEKVFTNGGAGCGHGRNAYAEKLRLLFDRHKDVESPVATIGIPRCLNEYEDYPFWHTLFTECGFKVELSSPSNFARYEQCARKVMSDNICFPAKLVHSHVDDLSHRGVDRIFMPYVIYERQDGGQNSFNCPIVSGYADVVRNAGDGTTPIDSPAVTFKDRRLLYKQCEAYLTSLGARRETIRQAFGKATQAMADYADAIADTNRRILDESRREGRLAIVLAGRPYHADPLVQHKIADMVAAIGADVLTEDVVRDTDAPTDGVNFVPQWAYATRILKAAEWTARQDGRVQMMQLTSFGCGPDAFLTDETRSLLHRHGKTLTLLKIDDVSNIGSIKLRVRSCIESLRMTATTAAGERGPQPFVKTPRFGRADRKRRIIAPFFTPFISPLIPAIVKLAGYDVDCLPPSDALSGELGLRYANNEVCYPATLIVGDIVKALRSGRYDPDDTAAIITQTGGQCRASNYISLIKKALTESGFANVPVISLASGSGIANDQPGFRINWAKMLPTVVTALIYSDCMAKLYYATVARERQKGAAKALLDKYIAIAAADIQQGKANRLWQRLEEAAATFALAADDRATARVGVVGEIFLKFNPFAQKGITEWLTEQGVEVVPPLLTDFFLQAFVNTRVNKRGHIERKTLPDCALRWAYSLVWRKIERANAICSRHRHFTPFESIFAKADEASRVVSLYAQFGEGWLLPGEVMSMAQQGVTHVVSLQPFGCIANHIVAKGIEKRVKTLCPEMNMLSLDFDSGVSDVNVRNRMLLFIDNLKKDNDGQQQARLGA